MRNFLLLITVILILAVLLSGCTLKFKATDLELDSEAVRRYKFNGLEFTNDTRENIFDDCGHLWQGPRRNILSG